MTQTADANSSAGLNVGRAAPAASNRVGSAASDSVRRRRVAELASQAFTRSTASRSAAGSRARWTEKADQRRYVGSLISRCRASRTPQRESFGGLRGEGTSGVGHGNEHPFALNYDWE